MKTRSDFVTNSSSSSFIIAKHKDYTSNNIHQLLNDRITDIKYVLNRWHQDDSDSCVYEFISTLTDMLSSDYELKLDDWEVAARCYSNEDDQYSDFMYSFGHKLSTDKFKVEACE